jgi:hypothetical protein
MKIILLLLLLVSPAHAAAPPQRCGCRIVEIANGSTLKAQPQPPPTRPYEPVRTLQVIRFGDLLYIDGSAWAICDGLRGRTAIASLPHYTPVPCDPAVVVIGRYRRRDTTTLGPSPTGAPQVLAPRSTKLMTGRPLIRWSTIPDAKKYELIIRGDPKQPVWRTVVDASADTEQSFQYPASEPELETNTAFKVIITANGRSSDDGEPNSGFKVAPPQDRQTVLERIAQLRSAELSPEAKTVLSADIYAANGFYFDAIETLRESALKSTLPDSRRTLADLYLDVGLMKQAEAVLRSIVDDPKISDADGAGAQAESLEVLANLVMNRGDRDSAAKLRERAQRLAGPH